jgi:hypothetical protein
MSAESPNSRLDAWCAEYGCIRIADSFSPPRAATKNPDAKLQSTFEALSIKGAKVAGHAQDCRIWLPEDELLPFCIAHDDAPFRCMGRKQGWALDEGSGQVQAGNAVLEEMTKESSCGIKADCNNVTSTEKPVARPILDIAHGCLLLMESAGIRAPVFSIRAPSPGKRRERGNVQRKLCSDDVLADQEDVSPPHTPSFFPSPPSSPNGAVFSPLSAVSKADTIMDIQSMPEDEARSRALEELLCVKSELEELMDLSSPCEPIRAQAQQRRRACHRMAPTEAQALDADMDECEGIEADDKFVMRTKRELEGLWSSWV